MKDPHFLLQSGAVSSAEKKACCFSDYPIRYSSFENLAKLNPQEDKLKYVPVGSVEFIREYARVMGMFLPEGLDFFYEELKPFLKRPVIAGTYSEAQDEEFVKPRGGVKLFTGGIKRRLEERVEENTPVWISPAVPFGAEFRYYIFSYANGGKILGWSRYDNLIGPAPDPDVGLVESIMEVIEECGAPNGYSIDIGWRTDIEKYCLVEINDGWALGYYGNTDFQSNPPSYKDYSELLIARWGQILFCNIV